jgi:hypothetical protein
MSGFGKGFGGIDAVVSLSVPTPDGGRACVDVAFKQSNAARQPITFSNQCAHLRG